MTGTFRNLALMIAALTIAYYFARPMQDFYCDNIGTCSGGFFGFDLGILIWTVLVYASTGIVLLVTFGGRHKYWWIALVLVPAFLLQVTVDIYHIFLLLIWSSIAWLLGTLLNKTLTKLAPQFMAKIST